MTVKKGHVVRLQSMPEKLQEILKTFEIPVIKYETEDGTRYAFVHSVQDHSNPVNKEIRNLVTETRRPEIATNCAYELRKVKEPVKAIKVLKEMIERKSGIEVVFVHDEETLLTIIASDLFKVSKKMYAKLHGGALK